MTVRELLEKCNSIEQTIDEISTVEMDDSGVPEAGNILYTTSPLSVQTLFRIRGFLRDYQECLMSIKVPTK